MGLFFLVLQHISQFRTSEKLSVAISFRFDPFFSQIDLTINRSEERRSLDMARGLKFDVNLIIAGKRSESLATVAFRVTIIGWFDVSS